ncbi:uncharacterized protein plekhg6 [Eucyclogobius newberryi]|uniref:uncharacterized protein plekhg6 n=1 Tax=Eucyclogobius newberryi TaxID=166745 RepID=UPI003B5B1825
MDPAKNSLSRAAHLNGAVNGFAPDDAPDPWSSEGERQRDGDMRETTGDPSPTAAEPTLHHRGSEPFLHHRGSAENHKKFFSYQRRTKQKVVSAFATAGKGTSGVAKPRAALRSVLFNQFEKNAAPEAHGQLDLLKHTLEAFTVPVSIRWSWAEENHGTSLESSWTDLVHSHSQMTKVQRNQQDTLWEFLYTELIYINKLLVIRELVLESLQHLHKLGFLLEVTAQLLFSNLPSIITAHQLFWQDVLFPMLQEVRRTGTPFDPMRLEAGCLQFRKRFASYKHYCWEEESTQDFARRLQESSPHFHAYVQWVESHPRAERMRLGDMQAKPHQRITKYPLLLGAILKNTSHSGVQQALRDMLSSVVRFLESINDYMRFKDEELALSISAERVEGYEVDGINEEIDRLVREVSTFDLTCPVSGVGPEVIRKLLLEENLKIRGRKDNKMEVVALLFSDVLLMTKAQKKGERLKVIRPPLALDKTHCFALKDGCSFVLVEVGELQSVMNVSIFVTATAHSCSTWVSTIQQAKETLREMRDKESSRQLDTWRLLLESKSQSEVNEDEAEETEAPLTAPSEDGAFEETLQEITEPKVNGPQAPHVGNGPHAAHVGNGPHAAHVGNGPHAAHVGNGPHAAHVGNGPHAAHVGNGPHAAHVGNGPHAAHVGNGPHAAHVGNGPHAAHVGNGPHAAHVGNGPHAAHVGNGPQVPQSPQGVNGPQSLDYTVFNGGKPLLLPPRLPRDLRPISKRTSLPPQLPVVPGTEFEFIEMRVRSPWFRTTSESNMVESSCGAESRGMNGKKVLSSPDLKQHFIFNTNSTQTHNTQRRSALPGEYPEVDYPIIKHNTLPRTSDMNLVTQWPVSEVLPTRRTSDSPVINSNSLSNITDPSESKGFPIDLRSPHLRRRRPLSTSHLAQPPTVRAADSWSVSNNSSSDSDSSVASKRNSVPSDKNSFRVLTLNSLKPNQGMFWAMVDDTQTLSEPELPDQSLHNKRAKMKAHRSASIPNINLQERSLQRPSGNVLAQAPPSPLHGLLIRAKERDRDPHRRDSCVKTSLLRPKFVPSPSVSTTPSPSPSESDRESKWEEEEVELLRHRVQSVSQGWTEQLVDGDDDDDRRNSPMFSDGVNVDWPGWCFDDEEVLDHLQPGGEGLMESITKSLPFCDLQEVPEHEEGECSQV